MGIQEELFLINEKIVLKERNRITSEYIFSLNG